MRYLLILIGLIILFPIVFKQPEVSGQSKEKVIATPTLEQKEARVLGAENDKRSLALNRDMASVTEQTVPNNKLREEVLRYKRKAYALQKENNYYRRKIFTLKKVLKVNYGKEPEFDKSILEYNKIDTVYLPTPPRKRKGILKIFN